MTDPHVENPHAGQGAVLLDIGGDVGALVVTMPSTMVGDEVEIRPVGDAAAVDTGHEHGHGHGHGHGHLQHVAVVERPTPDGPVPSLVFSSLASGRYELFRKGRSDQVELTVDVRGGEVSHEAWPG